MSLPILLDTDIGTDVDDALALALLLASPEVDLRAVTTVSGDARWRARIAKKLLTLAGRPDVAVAAGVREPVLRQRSFLWFGHEGRGIIEEDESIALSPAHGVDLLIDTVLRERPQVIAIGPLSNLAVAIMKEPEVIGAIPHLTIMGGSLGRARDRHLPTLEYNLCSDPEAALVVLNAGIPTTVVPLDVTWRVFLTSGDMATLRNAPSPLLRTLCAAIDVWAPLLHAVMGSEPAVNRDVVAFLHDPLTVAVLLDRSLVTMERLRLRPAIADGMFQLLEDKTAAEFDVATDVDVPRFTEFLMRRLQRLP